MAKFMVVFATCAAAMFLLLMGILMLYGAVKYEKPMGFVCGLLVLVSSAASVRSGYELMRD